MSAMDLDSDKPLPSSAHATSDVLWAAAKVIAPACAGQNLAYLRCKEEDMHPTHCLTKGKDVTSCVTDVLRKTEKVCSESFHAYRACLDRHHGKFDSCRKAQTAFEKCFNEGGQ